MSVLKKLRISKGITTYDLQLAGIGTNTYRAIEGDTDKTYTLKSLKKYKSVLGID